jgi:translation initiation factor IF-3
VKTRIGVHDLEIKVKHMREFLEQRDKVRFSIVFRGRELEHPEIGQQIAKKVKEAVADIAIVETDARLEGKFMSLLLAPKK